MRIHGSPALIRRIELETIEAGGGAGLRGGVDMTVSYLFPFVQSCSTCAGTGEGATSTYCPTCHGAGEVEVIGAVMDRETGWPLPSSSMTGIIQGPRRPVRFQPRFPAGIVSLPPMCRGLS